MDRSIHEKKTVRCQSNGYIYSFKKKHSRVRTFTNHGGKIKNWSQEETTTVQPLLNWLLSTEYKAKSTQRSK